MHYLEKMANKCFVIKCKHGVVTGDNLFCSEHRKEWRIFCAYSSMSEKTAQSLLKSALKRFLTY